MRVKLLTINYNIIYSLFRMMGSPKVLISEGPFGEISLTKVMIKQDFIKLFFWKLILLTCKRNPVSLVPIPCEVKLLTINYNIICSLFRMMTRL